MKRGKPSKTRSIEQDLETCLIISGYTGAGKSTIIRTSHELDIRLFGEEYHQHFRETNRSLGYEENDEYEEALKTSANFQGKHLHKLKEEQSLPKNLLIQLDLKHVAHKLGYKAASKETRIAIDKLTKIPTSHKNKSNTRICNLMMAGYLENPFFQRFKTIITNTVYTPFADNYMQYASREIKKGSSTNFKDRDKQEIEKKAHAAMYAAWRNNIQLLNPKLQFITTVNRDGDLISNDQCICANWKHKAGLA